MAVEFEVKALEIDPGVMAQRILAAGGRKVSDRFMRRYVYDIPGAGPEKWLRLRDDGTQVTMTVKEIVSDRIDGTLETEVRVDDFAAAADLLAALGYRPKGYQENRRESFTLRGVAVELDSWPMIPPYLEIEGGSEREVLEVAGLLGFTTDGLTCENTTAVYARYGIDLTAIGDLRFAEVAS